MTKKSNAPPKPKTVRKTVDHIGEHGEIISSKTDEEEFRPTYKRGWGRTYMANMFNILKVCNSSLEIQTVEAIVGSINREDLTVTIRPTAISKKIGCSKELVKKVVRKLKDIGYLRGSNTHYSVDPFCIIPYGTKRETISESQKKWLENSEK